MERGREPGGRARERGEGKVGKEEEWDEGGGKGNR